MGDVNTRYTRHESDFGPLLLLSCEGVLTGLFFADQPHAPAIDSQWLRDDDAQIFEQTLVEVDEYAAGHRQEFTLPVAPAGTPFQRQVWRELLSIGYGQTRSYGEIAARLGAFARAVGTATGRNPISIIIPCHRVIGSNGALTGYAGGIARKQQLLELERSAALATCHAPAA